MQKFYIVILSTFTRENFAKSPSLSDLNRACNDIAREIGGPDAISLCDKDRNGEYRCECLTRENGIQGIAAFDFKPVPNAIPDISLVSCEEAFLFLKERSKKLGRKTTYGSWLWKAALLAIVGANRSAVGSQIDSLYTSSLRHGASGASALANWSKDFAYSQWQRIDEPEERMALWNGATFENADVWANEKFEELLSTVHTPEARRALLGDIARTSWNALPAAVKDEVEKVDTPEERQAILEAGLDSTLAEVMTQLQKVDSADERAALYDWAIHSAWDALPVAVQNRLELIDTPEERQAILDAALDSAATSTVAQLGKVATAEKRNGLYDYAAHTAWNKLPKFVQAQLEKVDSPSKRQAIIDYYRGL